MANIFGILGVPVYYADTEAKRLMNTDEELKQTISRIFGPEAYVDRQLNRPYIAAKVFNHAGMLDQLNTAVHPAVHRDFLRWCNRHSDAPYVIEEAAILVESGGSKQFDVILVVNADEAVRIRRVKARDGITEEEIRSRMARQMKPEDLNRYADYI
ncbi:MAG TPA: dephospho-CoA kinase, partial [Bacteroidales bacterium]|nr:dephospho-CoA kinase [Bacteroidales bacterium]